MKTLKVLFSFVLFFVGVSCISAQSISVTGGGTWTLSPSETTHSFYFGISYNTGGLQTTSLHYKVDGGALVPSNYVGDGSNNPDHVDIPLGEGNHTIKFIWYGYDWGRLLWFIADSTTKTSTVKFNVSVTNIFNGGNVIKDGVQTTSGALKTVMSGNSIGLGAIEQDYGNYHWVWATTGNYPSEWLRKKYNGQNSYISSSQSTNYSIQTDDNATTLEAGLRKVCNVTFQNSMPEGGSNIGNIMVDGTSYSVTKVVQKVEGNSVSFSDASQAEVNGIIPLFYKWNEDGSTSSSRTVTINSHTNFTAIYKGKPSTSSRNLRFNDGAYGSYVTLTWSAHPSSNVTQCKIYQKVRVNGVMGSEYLIASVSAGTTTYVDYGYTVSSNTTRQLFYDVRYVYTGTLPDNTQYTVESDPNYQNIYGQIAPSYNDGKKEVASALQELPTNYSIGNYPNPFNPTTTINYQLPENGFVTIKVYDVLGKEVATLVNENKSAGYYKVDFDASRLTSGVYIYTITANNFTLSKKMLLMK